MNDESVITNVNQGLTSRLQRLDFLRKFYLTIGHAATRGLFANGRSTRSKDEESPKRRLVHSLQELARQTKKMKDDEDLEEVLVRSNQVLASAKSVFPWTLFPDTIILDRTKLTVIRRSFFMTEDVMSIRIEDILNVSATVGPIFGSITIATRVMSSTDHFTLNHFLREDVMHLKHLIQGYVIARHNNIACDHLSYDELIHTLRELGHETIKQQHHASYFTGDRFQQKPQ
jgi:hypothetical protein